MAQMTKDELRKHARGYWGIFVALMALTIITVRIAYLDLEVPAAIALALFVAAIKGSLVACFFMHLIDEKKLIYWTLALTAILFIPLMFLPLGQYMNAYF